MSAINKIVNLNPSCCDIYINNLKNPAKASTTAQTVAAVAINVILLGIPYFFMKAWSLHNEQGKYFLLNPKEVYRLKYGWVAQDALRSNNKAFLGTVINMNFEAFQDHLYSLYEKHQDLKESNRFNLTEQQKAELRHMKVLFEIMDQYIRSRKKLEFKNEKYIHYSQTRSGEPRNVCKPLKPIREKLEEIRRKMWTFWNHVLPEHKLRPLMSYGACGN